MHTQDPRFEMHLRLCREQTRIPLPDVYMHYQIPYVSL